MRKRWIAVFLGVLMILGALVYVKYCGKVEYELATVERGDIGKDIKDEVGVFEPYTVINVGSQIAGKITEICVDFNTSVKKGDILAKVDSDLSHQRLEKTERRIDTLFAQKKEMVLAIENAQMKLETSGRHFEQNKILFNEKIISKEDYNTSCDNFKISLNDLEIQTAKLFSKENELKEAEADLAIARFEFENSFIRAPIDGIVLDKQAEIGQTVSGSSFQVYPLFRICNSLEDLKFVAPVDEVNIGNIFIGQEMKIIINTTGKEEIIISTVREIRNQPKINQDVAKYDVISYIKNADLKIKPGMKADFEINIILIKDVLKISKEKMRKAKDYAVKSGFNDGVFILNNGKIESRLAREGEICVESITEIKGEIREGDRIITGVFYKNSNSAKTIPWQGRFSR